VVEDRDLRILFEPQVETVNCRWRDCTARSSAVCILLKIILR